MIVSSSNQDIKNLERLSQFKEKIKIDVSIQEVINNYYLRDKKTVKFIQLLRN